MGTPTAQTGRKNSDRLSQQEAPGVDVQGLLISVIFGLNAMNDF